MHLLNDMTLVLSIASLAAAAPVEKRQTSSNELKSGSCKPLIFICARGSTEPGNMGMSVCPSVAKYLKSSSPGGVTVQGVDYTASIASNASMGKQGGAAMAALIKQAKSKCPSSKIAVGGYSQGGMVVHQALKSAGGDVSAAVLYGDPMQRSTITGTPNKKFCASGDGVCLTGGFAITAGHLAYTSNGDTKAGAQFIISNTRGGSASAASSSGSDDTAAAADDSASGSAASGGLASLMGGSGASKSDGMSSLLSGMGGGASLAGAGDAAADESTAASTDDASAASTDDSASAASGGLASLMSGGSGSSKVSGLMGGLGRRSVMEELD